MLLETKIDENIRRAIDLCKSICEDPSKLSSVETILGETRRIDLITEAIRLSGIQNRERKARAEVEFFEKIKNTFGTYIGHELFKKLDLKIDVPIEVYTRLGRLFIENY